MLHTLFCDSAEMEKIILIGRGLSLDTVSMVAKFEHLRVLELVGMGEALDIDVLERIGALPSLVSLTLDFTESTIVLTLEKDIGLKDLKSLTVTAPLPFTRSFLPKISTTTLESLGAMCPSQPLSNKKEFLEEVVERWGETLRRVELVHQQVQVDAGGAGGTLLDMELLSMDALALLLPLKKLTYLKLEG
ncbi:hypothetical protein CPB84DRAFT_1852872 [Gymnopilus junonius]|uniref:Uncharacterized protein n=1 Tax=Gymnopilus junonius TaxID=109634 RepID=A0A9P5NA82_GYMJU|nr:hypothetical protein CPB84DRAFT_1852872 [Gymnopilus junonius]